MGDRALVTAQKEGDDFYSSRYTHLHNRDLPLLRKMGANAVRIWGWHESVDHSSFLNAAFNGGVEPLYVVATFNPDFGFVPGTFDVSGN